MSVINMTPGVLHAVNHLCEADNVDCIIGRLQYAEEALQKTAYKKLSIGKINGQNTLKGTSGRKNRVHLNKVIWP